MLMSRFGRLPAPSPRLLYVICTLVGAGACWAIILLTRSNVSVASLQRIAISSLGGSPAETSVHPTFPFPRKIWQTGPPVDSTRDNTKSISTWSRKNPTFRYEFLTDLSAEQYVLDQFNDHARIREAYGNITDVILRADLLRLLLMWRSGGVYSDIDTNCLVPVLDWVPEEYYNATKIVLGVEIDLSEDDVAEDRKKDFQLCQWTLMAMPGSVHFERVIETILNGIEKVAKAKGVSISELGKHVTIPEVILTTGPKAFTEALLQSISTSLGETVTNANISGLKAPRLIDDVLILPVNAFAGHQKHSHSGEWSRGPKLIQHHFASSWWKAKQDQ